MTREDDYSLANVGVNHPDEIRQKNQKKTGKKSSKPVKQRTPKVRRTTTSSKALSMADICAIELAKAFIDPFASAEPLCNPTVTHGMPAIRLRAFARVVAKVGTNGIGFALFNPSPCSDGSSITFSTDAWTGGSGTALPSSGTGVENQALQGCIVSTSDVLGGAAQMRSVVAGIKGHYTGTVLNRGGQYVLWNDFEDYNTVGMTPDAILSRPTARVVPVGQEPVMLRWASASARAKEFSTSITAADVENGGGAGVEGKRPLAIIFTGPAGNEFMFDFVYYHEVRFNTLQQLQVKPHPSQLGDDVLTQANEASTQAEQTKTFMEGLRENLPSSEHTSRFLGAILDFFALKRRFDTLPASRYGSGGLESMRIEL